MILAHRGDSFRAPENTMAAAILGHEAGADGWELDVRLTADGHPVVIHDLSLRRTTNVDDRFAGDDRGHLGFPVDRFTLDEIRSLDAGSWFVNEASDEPRSARGFGTLDQLDPASRARFGSGTIGVPTLIEALQWTLDVGWLINIELKPTNRDAEALVDRVLETVERLEAWDLVTISSFEPLVVEKVARSEPRVATGALISGPLDRLTEEWIEAVGVDAVHGPPWSSTPRPERPLMVYTVNDSRPGGLAWRLAEAEVTGLFTDDPIHLKNLFPLNRS